MTFAKSDSFQPAGQGPAPGARPHRGDGRLGLYLVLAALLALLAWGLPEGAEGPELRQDRSAAPSEGAAEPQPVFDGRGKWGGYAR